VSDERVLGRVGCWAVKCEGGVLGVWDVGCEGLRLSRCVGPGGHSPLLGVGVGCVCVCVRCGVCGCGCRV
jgi:hypothetical protein